MQAKILYEQAHPIEGQDLDVPQSELFIMHMNRCFGEFPVELDKTHLDKLFGMASTWTDVSINPYDVLIRAIKRLGSVKVWAAYPEAKIDDSKANHHDTSVTADPAENA